MKPHVSAMCVLMLALVGCSRPLSPDQQRERYREEGWTAYRAGNFTEAETKFRQAAELDSRDGEAQLGVAWSLIRQDRLASALTAIGRISSQDPAYIHATAAGAIIFDAQGQHGEALLAARTVLLQDSLYVFPHDDRITWRTLCYVAGKSALVLAPVADPDLSRTMAFLARVDAEPPVVPDDPTTWYAAGVRYAALMEVLAKRLEGVFYAQVAQR
ncbi:MAG TPA: tetratricopeptide repeat protein [Candidatus Latescibacteria bacterium]|nr:tetratricopeptide repeat protein [Candidatus Latescibacterota bacterium]HOF60422.1 tetratricopeptide repeat protein [Candidatus Latescibacterota bacterium]HOS64259.1 tetratricopeptide repeat protein [Candidatus Latescibacterota bacterium]HPK74416.1 tetratricopeptide repeat protein [Candidatus Latescibacterota bacterium]